MNSKSIIFGLLAIIFVIILLQNTHMIKVNFLFWEINTSTFYIPIVIIIGIASGYLISKLKYNNKKKKDPLDY